MPREILPAKGATGETYRTAPRYIQGFYKGILTVNLNVSVLCCWGEMGYTFVCVGYRRYSDRDLDKWETHVKEMEAILNADPEDFGAQSALEEAKRVIADIRRHAPPDTKRTGLP